MALNIFPTTNAAWPVEKSASWATRVQRSISGREVSLADYFIPLYNFTLTWEVLRDKWDTRGVGGTTLDEWRAILNFYNGQQGPNIPFAFFDVTDNTTRADPSTPQVFNFAVGDGTTQQFVLTTSLFAPAVPGVVNSVNLNGSPTSAYTIDSNSGRITFTSAPGAGVFVGWDATYYYRVRFSTDNLVALNFLYQRWSIRQLKFVSRVD